jgi:L-lactate dehydrogenase complex protein LldE
MRVAVFVTCLVDALFPEVGQATVRLLRRLGHEVDFPAEQVCCGQMHINSGYAPDALVLVRRHVDAFEAYETIVTPSGSCAASVRHQHARLARQAGDEELARRSDAVASRTWELSEFLVDMCASSDVGAHWPHRVTYHPPCHALRLLRVGDRPLELLRQVRGIDLVPLNDAEVCCGFGGTFALKNSDTSTAMLADKMAAIIGSRAEHCATSDASCMMHIGGGLSRLRTGVRAIHLAQILAATEEG